MMLAFYSAKESQNDITLFGFQKMVLLPKQNSSPMNRIKLDAEVLFLTRSVTILWHNDDEQ